jgi:hypothetical protein
LNEDTLSSKFLDDLQREAFGYFVRSATPLNGLIADTSQAGSPASIAAVGFALSAYPVAVERGFITRADAIKRTLATLRFFHGSARDASRDATGHRGFYYHFLDMNTGKRVWNCELSTIDTALLLAGMLTAAQYFSGDGVDEKEIGELAEILYARADWNWARNGGDSVTLGWKPKSGFLRYRWQGYSEALILYLLGLGSPTHPLPPDSYRRWTDTYDWRRVGSQEYLHAGPLFIHQFPHIWVDFRDIQDEFMRGKGSDYFENSRRATHAQRQYGIENPRGFAGYGENCWGITASHGPGPASYKIKGTQRRFFAYRARGAPDGPDDGTISPWAVAASLPFAPEIVSTALRYFVSRETDGHRPMASFNATIAERSSRPAAWVSPTDFGINRGPVVLMLENHRTGLVWNLMRRNRHLVTSLRRAGFSGGWLGEGARS